MFKKIKNFICKLFHIKACQCTEEMDEHIEYFIKIPEPEIPVHNDKQPHCGSHIRFIKSCPQCIAITS
jgi:hypothetical protein